MLRSSNIALSFHVNSKLGFNLAWHLLGIAKLYLHHVVLDADARYLSQMFFLKALAANFTLSDFSLLLTPVTSLLLMRMLLRLLVQLNLVFVAYISSNLI